ncbi:MAG: TRAP transporter small permease subunit [Gammaproteobacteria bacterium]|nr:TRAP transporter small permease subunit [Gammaproteobacteria bacterium]
MINTGWIQLAGYITVLLLSVFYAVKSSSVSLLEASDSLQMLAAYLIRVSFWAVMLIGFVDMLISFLHIEGFLELWVGKELLVELGRPSFRGTYVHYPLLVSSFVFALIFRNISFSWLALMVVLAEFQIVLTRFIFSYEQAFQGDLVRFWYAALFLFASAYTLINEGHVRVDVLYAGFSRTKKAWANIVGSLFLGIPLCWVILMHGMGGKGNSINSPLLSFEISQSGYGMYVKYLMVGFLVVFSVTMIIQFSSYLLRNIATLTDPDKGENDKPDDTHDSVLSDSGLAEGMRINTGTETRES